jgi:myo-inositol 2-dehydrogenase/D-chiro-inositol 1-dehydrogenase
MASYVNIGVIGAGQIGKLHAGHLCCRIPKARVAAIADVRLEAAQACAAALGITKAAADPRVILDDPEIDAVAICSSTDTHATLIEAAAAAGKHIFCEKPIAMDLSVIDRALEKVRKAGVKLQIGFNRRFDPNFRRIWERLQEGAIGEPHMLRITSRDPAPPTIAYVRASGGLFLEL